jgi:hypothetical protein
MATDTFASFGARVGRFQESLKDDAISHALGKMAKTEATKAASADLGGDPKFSGWAPTLDTRYEIIGPGRISFHPTKRSAGPWTVAESGRNQGNASGVSGPGISQATGETSRTSSGALRKVRGRKSKRWNGRTRGKGSTRRRRTWSTRRCLRLSASSSDEG